MSLLYGDADPEATFRDFMNAISAGTPARRAQARLAKEHQGRYRELLAEENARWQGFDAQAALAQQRLDAAGAVLERIRPHLNPSEKGTSA